MRESSAGCQETSFSEDTAGSLPLYRHTSLDPTDGASSTLKRWFQKMPLSFFIIIYSFQHWCPNDDHKYCMFKLAVGDLWSLCAVFQMPHFIRSGPTRMWAWNWREDKNKQLSSAKTHIMRIFFAEYAAVLVQWQDWSAVSAKTSENLRTQVGSGQYFKLFTRLTSDPSQM